MNVQTCMQAMSKLHNCHKFQKPWLPKCGPDRRKDDRTKTNASKDTLHGWIKLREPWVTKCGLECCHDECKDTYASNANITEVTQNPKAMVNEMWSRALQRRPNKHNCKQRQHYLSHSNSDSHG